MDDPYWEALVLQWGATVYSADGTRCVLDSPQAIGAIQFLHDLIYRYKVMPSPGDIDAMSAAGGWGTAGMQMFSAHRAAMAIGGRWWLLHATKHVRPSNRRIRSAAGTGWSDLSRLR